MSGGDDGKRLMSRQLNLELQEPVRSQEKELLEEAIIITHYVSPTKFRYIMLQELQENGRMVNHLESKLPALCEADNCGKIYKRFQYVILRYYPLGSEKYMRGQVINIHGDGYIVEALDYGFLINCQGKDLWQLPQKLCNIYIQIKDGGLFGVSSSSGDKWSNREVKMLNQKLEMAVLLIFRIKYQNYGQLLIKSPHQDEPLLNAVDYLIENQCARQDHKHMTPRSDESPFNMDKVELNVADVKPSACVATIIRLMELQHIKLPLCDPDDNPKEENQHSKQKNVPKMQQKRLRNLCLENSIRTVPESAKRLSMVKNRNESTVESALISGSSSISSSASNCSSDSFDFSSDRRRRSALDPMIRAKINQELPVQEKPEKTQLLQSKLSSRRKAKLARSFDDIRNSVFNPENKPTTSEAFLNITKEPLKKSQEKPMPSSLFEEKLDHIIDEVRNTANPLKKSSQSKSKAVLESQDREYLDCIIKKMSDLNNPVKKVTEHSLQGKNRDSPKKVTDRSPQLKSKAVLESQDKEKLDRIIKEMGDLNNPVKKVAEQSSGVKKPQHKLSPLNPLEKSKAVLKSHDIKVSKMRAGEKSLAKERSEINSIANEQLLLAHSNGQVSAINGTPETLFCQDVWMNMTAMNYQTPLPMQRYTWPHLMRVNSLVLIDGIGRGRSWCYLPMLCSLVLNWMQRPTTRNGNALNLGPLAVLLADSVGNARMLFNHCCNLMKSNNTQMLKVINTHDHSLLDVQLMLLNSCGILITTVSHMKRLFIDNELNLIDPHRLKYFIVDDYDRMLSAVPDLLHESLQLLQKLASPQIQLILIAQQWHGRVFLQLMKRFNHNPLLLFGDFLVAAIYGNLKMDVKLRHSSKKTLQLIDYLSNLAKASVRKRTVIYCKSKEELVDLEQALTATGHKCIGLSDAVHQQIHELLLVTDQQQQPTQLPMRNFDLLVHYSLPASWQKFSYRFHAIIDNIGNCLVPEEKQKDILSYVMLDENNIYELLRLAQFLKAHDVKMDKHIDQMVASCRQVTDQNRVFCPQMLSSGDCGQMLCNNRHFTIDEDFLRPKCDLWQSETVVRCKLIKVYNPVHFAVMAESYKSSDCESWKATLSQSKLKNLCTSLSLHMSLEKNRRKQQKLQISDICVIFRDMRYQRVRVVDLSDQRLVGVQLLDEGTELLKVKPSELLECDAKFKEFPPLSMDVRLCGLIPSSIGEGNWLTEASKWISEELIDLHGNQYLQLLVEFAMLDTVYVREITLMQECPTMGTCVKTMQLGNELIMRGFGLREEQSIKRLCLMHQEFKKQQQLNNPRDGMVEKDIIQEESDEKRLAKTKVLEELKKSSQQLGQMHQENKQLENESIEAFHDRKNEVQLPQEKEKLEEEPAKTLDKLCDGEKADEVDVNKEEDDLKSVAADEEYSPSSTDHFLDVLLKNLQSNDPMVKKSAKQIIQEILADDNPVARTSPKREKTTTRPQITPDTLSKSLYCASTAGNAVRPKVRWHQTLMQIELIFEQQVPQYELIHQDNVLIYQVLETTPPQRCILNLLGEVKLLSEQQHGYQLHVKLAKHNLNLYWPTLLSSLSAQQHCHWLVYDTERGKSSQSEMGRILWTRYQRGLCPSNLTDDEGSNYSSDDERSYSDDE
ncbi:putative ATP-dependent RNA helicase SoYb [Drosophila innubila]|uniref:putative ATP-dependent RNA helicase SoYb n=1 Tax=Drosophila innubila TaxID=198719 RepID=UPI00148E8FB6|nr:putative ATP-dependent RNA helicase SoYb [Drosophila innubila]